MSLLVNLVFATVGLFILKKSFCNAVQGEYITSPILANKRLPHEIKSELVYSQKQCLELCIEVSLFFLEIEDSAIKEAQNIRTQNILYFLRTNILLYIANHIFERG